MTMRMRGVVIGPMVCACLLTVATLRAQAVISPTVLLPPDTLSLASVPNVAALEEQVQKWGRSFEWEGWEQFSLQSWIKEIRGFDWPLDPERGVVAAECAQAAEPGAMSEIWVMPITREDEAERIHEEWGFNERPVQFDPYIMLNLTEVATKVGAPARIGCGLPESLMDLRLSGQRLFGASLNLLEKAALKVTIYKLLLEGFELRSVDVPSQARKFAKSVAYTLLPALEEVTASLEGKNDRGRIKIECVFRSEKALGDLSLKLGPEEQARMLGPLPMDHCYHAVLPAELYSVLSRTVFNSQASAAIDLPPASRRLCAALLESVSGAQLSQGGYLGVSWGTGHEGMEIVGVVQSDDGIAALNHAIETLRAKPWREKGLRWIFGESSSLRELKLLEATLYVLPDHFTPKVSRNSHAPEDPVEVLERLFNCEGGLRLQIVASKDAVLVSMGLSKEKFMECAAAMQAPPSFRILNEEPSQPHLDVMLAGRLDFTAIDRASKWVQETLDGETSEKPPRSNKNPKYSSFSLIQHGRSLSLDLKFRAEPALKHRLQKF